MTPQRNVGVGLLTAALLTLHSAAGAQAPDRLRVLRFKPDGLAAPDDSLVIAFDHPVAPKLDRSVDPKSVVRITPAVPLRAYWRDPSTIVVALRPSCLRSMPGTASNSLPRFAARPASCWRTERGGSFGPERRGSCRELPVEVRRWIIRLRFSAPLVVFEAAVPLSQLHGSITAGSRARDAPRADAYRARTAFDPPRFDRRSGADPRRRA